MQITVRYQSIDGVNKRKTFGTLAGVRKWVDERVGPNAEYGSSGMYAVSADGVGKVTLVEVRLADGEQRDPNWPPLLNLAALLKPAEPAKVGQFGVAYGYVNEDSGSTWWTTDDTQAFATVGEAQAFIDGITELGCDGIKIVGFTEGANALLQQWREQQAKIAEAAAEIPF